MQKQSKLVINYNNESIAVKRDASLEQLMRNKKLMQCPIQVWHDLLIEKDGDVADNTLKTVLLKQIANYDSSAAVNSFLIAGKEFWLDKSTRVGLQQLVNSSKDNVSLVLGDQVLTIPKDIASEFLANLEVYAGECYLQTAKHQIAVNSINSVEELLKYDYTRGYPDKLIFKV